MASHPQPRIHRMPDKKLPALKNHKLKAISSDASESKVTVKIANASTTNLLPTVVKVIGGILYTLKFPLLTDLVAKINKSHNT